MYAELAVLIIVLAMAAVGYLRGKFITSVLTFISSVLATAASFGYYERVSQLLISRGFLGQWVYAVVFLFIFAVVFTIVNTLFDKFLFAEILFKDFVDRAGRTLFASVTGFIMAGVLLTAAAMVPIPSQWPYERFSSANSPGDLGRNKTLILNADGFVSRLFSLISAGSLRSGTSFSVVHPEFIDELHLNRQDSGEDITIISGVKAIKIKAAWTVDTDLVSSSPENPVPQSDGKAVIVRIEFSAKQIRDGGGLDANGEVKFVLAQLKLICKDKAQAGTLRGQSRAVYPVGFISSKNTVEVKKPSGVITLDRSSFKGGVKWLDFVFYIPNSTTPVLMQFKQGAFASVPKLTGSDKAPAVIDFIQPSDCSTTVAAVASDKSAILYGVKLSAGEDLVRSFPLAFRTTGDFQLVAEDVTGLTTRFSNNKILYTQVKIVYDSYAASNRNHGFVHILGTAKGRKLLGLKTNSPPLGSSISSAEFPSLKDLNGNIHRPVGVVVKGTVGGKVVFEVDYNGLSDNDSASGSRLGSGGNFAVAFPDKLWLPQQADGISELYFLYSVKTQQQTIITEILPSSSSSKGAVFKGTSGFLVE